MLLDYCNSTAVCHNQAQSISVANMKSRRELTPPERAAATRLRALFDAEKARTGLSQLNLALACNWSTQGAVSQFLLGRIALNPEALRKFANYFKVTPADIYPELAQQLGMDGAVSEPITPAIKEDRPHYDPVPSQLHDLLNAAQSAWNAGALSPALAKQITGLIKALPATGEVTAPRSATDPNNTGTGLSPTALSDYKAAATQQSKTVKKRA